MEEENKTPEDLGLVVATKEEAFWTDVIRETEDQLERLKKMLKFQEAVLGMAKANLEDEQEREEKEHDSKQ